MELQVVGSRQQTDIAGVKFAQSYNTTYAYTHGSTYPFRQTPEENATRKSRVKMLIVVTRQVVNTRDLQYTYF